MKNINTKTLQEEIDSLQKQIHELTLQKKFGLVWEDKLEDIVTQCQTHLPVLSEVKSKKVSGTSTRENVIVEGDNYHALSVLNYTHRKSVDLIYIDPPYNTGVRDWKYNNDL